MPNLPSVHPSRVLIAFLVTVIMIGLIPLTTLLSITAAVGSPLIDPTPDLSTRSLLAGNEMYGLEPRDEDFLSVVSQDKADYD
jgi:hypothetical protein